MLKLRQKIERKTRNIYKVEAYENKRGDTADELRAYSTQQPKVTYKDFEREYDEKLAVMA